MCQPLVSLISPCYNGEKYLVNFFESLLSQDYMKVEFIFINDGSTDATEDIFMRYKPEFENKGWKILYIEQENQGASSAINSGLKLVSGKYLICPDSDDILFPEHIKKMVNFMEANPNFALGYCDIAVVDESDLDTIIEIRTNSQLSKENFYEHILNMKLNIWGSISNIINMKYFIESNPEKDIFCSRAGQNFQLLFPLAIKHPVGFLREILGKYVIRSSSHSRTYNKNRTLDLFDVWINTIIRCHIENWQKTALIKKTISNFIQNILPISMTVSKICDIKIFNFLSICKIYKIVAGGGIG